MNCADFFPKKSIFLVFERLPALRLRSQKVDIIFSDIYFTIYAFFFYRAFEKRKTNFFVKTFRVPPLNCSKNDYRNFVRSSQQEIRGACRILPAQSPYRSSRVSLSFPGEAGGLDQESSRPFLSSGLFRFSLDLAFVSAFAFFVFVYHPPFMFFFLFARPLYSRTRIPLSSLCLHSFCLRGSSASTRSSHQRDFLKDTERHTLSTDRYASFRRYTIYFWLGLLDEKAAN